MSLDLTSDFLQFNIAMPEASKNRMFSFDRFKLDPERLMLYRDGTDIPLPPKVVKTLLVLIERSGEIVSKDELIDMVWPGSIVEESNLSQNLYLLRKTLGPKPDGKSYIETLRRRGYRFTGNAIPILKDQVISESNHERPRNDRVGVEREGNVFRLADWNTQPEPSAVNLEKRKGRESPTRSTVFAIFALAGLLVAAIAVTAFFSRERSSTSAADRREPTLVRLTSGSMPVGATISDDGSYFAYIDSHGETSRLYVQQVGQATKIEAATSDELLFQSSTFSPDGRDIYLSVIEKQTSTPGLYRVAAIGGPINKILENVAGPISFAPDGAEFVYVRVDQQTDTSELVISDLAGKDQRILVQRKLPDMLLIGHAWSPDRRSIAFSEYIFDSTVTSSTRGWNRIATVDLLDGSISDISNEKWEAVYRMAWTKDGSGLLFISTRLNEAHTVHRDQVYFVSVVDGGSRRVTTEGYRHEPSSLGVAIDGSILAVPVYRSSQLWVMDSSGERSSATQITRGIEDGRAGLCTLPDGRIAYITRNMNHLTIWISEADGSASSQIATGFEFLEELRADPTGRYLVFAGVKDGTSQLFRMGIDSSDLRQITFEKERVIDSTVSPDGKTILMGLFERNNTSQRFFLGRTSLNGGEPARFGNVECQSPSFSPDGTMVSCISPKNEVMILSAADGSELERIKIPTNATVNFGTGWARDSSGVTVILNEDGTSNLWVFGLGGAKPKALTNFTSGVIYRYATSADGLRLFLARGQPNQDVVRISGFL